MNVRITTAIGALVAPGRGARPGPGPRRFVAESAPPETGADATSTPLRRLRQRRCRKLGHVYLYTESLGPECCYRCGEREIIGPTTVTVITPDGWPKSP